MLGDAEKAFVIEGVCQNIRIDGRNRLDYRAISVDTNVITHLNGSSRVSVGNTTIVVGVTAKLTEPKISMPNCGFIEIKIHPMSKLKSKEFESKIAHLVPSLRKAYTSPDSFDLQFLCLIPGKKCWGLYLDIIIIEDDGSLLDTVSIGIYSALYNCTLPKVNVMDDDCNEIEINDDENIKIDPSTLPIMITFYKIGIDKFILDPNIQEEYCSDCMLQITVNKTDILAINQDGYGVISVDKIDLLKQEAFTIAQDLINKLKLIFSEMKNNLNIKQSFIY